MGKAIIREGDSTSHGGVVLEAFPSLKVYGKNAAGVGHQGYCPRCKRTFYILGGAENYTFMGRNVAVEGMPTSCGAVLIASQGQATVDATPGESIATPSSSRAADKKALAAASQKNENWIKFALNEDGSCEGLVCIAHFDDGSQMRGEFNVDNQVIFNGVSGNSVERIEFVLDKKQPSGSVAELLLDKLEGQK